MPEVDVLALLHFILLITNSVQLTVPHLALLHLPHARITAETVVINLDHPTFNERTPEAVVRDLILHVNPTILDVLDVALELQQGEWIVDCASDLRC